MSSLNRYESSLLKCLGCNARGAVTWQAAKGGAHTILVKIAGDFHIEVGRTTPHGKAIVCKQCNKIYEVLPADCAS